MPSFIVIWIWICAYLNCAGWTLSALHQLNAGGYAVALALGLAAVLVWSRKTGTPVWPKIYWPKLRRRFRRGFPLAFLILASLAFLGGALYAPSNYDALAYRIPRVLHWLEAGQWHWIHTIFTRVNARACGVEWVSAPIIALSKTDRLLFLINTVSFLLLPGVVFSVFTRLGVKRRVAWYWMWLVPTAYGLLLQAGSVGNDLFGAVFVLAAMDYALRAATGGRAGDFFTAIVAAGMLTACKLSNLPLLLPWGLAILPAWKLVLRWPGRTLVVAGFAAGASLLPTIALNLKHATDWTGEAMTAAAGKDAPLWRVGANSVLVTIENFVPPVFPIAEQWNQAVPKILPTSVLDRLAGLIESPGCKFSLEQMQIEENSGLGFGLSVLLLTSVLAACWQRPPQRRTGFTWQDLVRWSPALVMLVVLAKFNLSAIARLFVPYYALFLPPLLALAGQDSIVRKFWWRRMAGSVFVLAAGLLVISPARPLFPVLTILDKMSHPPERMQRVYTVYRERPDAFAPVKALLPPDLKVLGLVTFDDPETSLWQPFGFRRIEHVCRGDSAASLKARGIRLLLIRSGIVEEWFQLPLAEWLKNHEARIIQTIPLNLRAATGPRDWYLVQLD